MSDSEIERTLEYQIKVVGLPAPEREYRFCPARKWQSDFAWPDLKVMVEVEGGTYIRGRHTRPEGYRRDCEKYNVAAILGWKVLRFTSEMVNSGEAIEVIEQVLKDVEPKHSPCTAA